MRMRAFEELGHEVVPLDTTETLKRDILSRVVRRLQVYLGVRTDIARSDERLAAAGAERHDMIWLDKQTSIRPRTLAALKAQQPSRLIVGFSPDDMMNRMNMTRLFKGSLRFYDAYFTTKSFGVAELEAMGLPKGFFIGNGYDAHTHRIHPMTAEEVADLGGNVGFIGTYEKDRANQINFLAENGIEVNVFGAAWRRRMHRNVHVKNRELIGDAFAKSIYATRINLCFLRKMNRDLQTTRSVEIPASGGFMLAERTAEHLELFEEGKEAAFFEGRDELLRKVRYYLEHEDERAQVAAAGHLRCQNSGYSYLARTRQMLEMLQTIPGAAALFS
jgi:hypothetical protein